MDGYSRKITQILNKQVVRDLLYFIRIASRNRKKGITFGNIAWFFRNKNNLSPRDRKRWEDAIASLGLKKWGERRTALSKVSLSKYLKELHGLGLIDKVSQGKNKYYRLSKHTRDQIARKKFIFSFIRKHGLDEERFFQSIIEKYGPKKGMGVYRDFSDKLAEINSSNKDKWDEKTEKYCKQAQDIGALTYDVSIAEGYLQIGGLRLVGVPDSILYDGKYSVNLKIQRHMFKMAKELSEIAKIVKDKRGDPTKLRVIGKST